MKLKIMTPTSISAGYFLLARKGDYKVDTWMKNLTRAALRNFLDCLSPDKAKVIDLCFNGTREVYANSVENRAKIVDIVLGEDPDDEPANAVGRYFKRRK